MMSFRLATPPRLAAKASIKRASARARAQMNRFDRARLSDLDALYRRAGASIEQDILGYAAGDGSLRLEVLRQLQAQVNARLDVLSRARDDLFGGSLLEAARIGVDPFRAAPGIGFDLVRIPEEAVRFVQSFISEDGLQLSDRIWRLDRGAREAVGQAIESAVIQGHSASRAVDDFLARGAAAPADLRTKTQASSAGAVGRAARNALVASDDDSARANAMRVFRTEMNRAHGEAYRAAAFEHPDVVGTRFLLSPNHPRYDVCDMHASANPYGLGPGVYPPGKSPWPAHPNTLSYEEVVFADEVTPEDRAGRESRLDWLRGQPADMQAAVLGSQAKRVALERGLLTDGQIGTPWRALKRRYEQQGIDLSSFDAPGHSNRGNIGAPNRAYRVAISGGTNAGLITRYRSDPEPFLERAVRSFERRISEHQAWIASPKGKLGDGTPERSVRHYRHKWAEDIQRQRDQRDVIKGILDERRKSKS